MKQLTFLLALLIILAGCSTQNSDADSQPMLQSSAAEPISMVSDQNAVTVSAADSDGSSATALSLPTPTEYIRQAVKEVAGNITTADMTEYQMVKATYDYLIASCVYAKPVALDAWRFRSNGNPAPSYLEVRSQSILNYGIGTCEDYSAAMILLLEEMGIEARYVPGLTYTVSGAYADHAWIVAKVDGVWYHLDVQLEDGISRRNTIRYRYFLKSDASMRASHLWGQDLVKSGRLSEDQNLELSEGYLPPTCPQDSTTPAASTFATIPCADKQTVEAALMEEMAEYEAQHGKLSPMDIDRIPPVFGRYRGYNRRNSSDYNEADNLAKDYDTVLIPEPRQDGNWIVAD